MQKPKTIEILIVLMLCIIISAVLANYMILSGGFPYFKDNNESFLSYIHAWNLYYYSPLKYSFLTAQDSSILTHINGIPSDIYTHNPNLPRYLHYLFFLIGIKDFLMQYWFITGLLFFVVLMNLRKYLSLMKLSTLTIIPIVFYILIDLQGVQAALFNTFRIWSFILYLYCLNSVISRNKYACFISFFLLFQFEYGFAIFVSLTTFLYCILSEASQKEESKRGVIKSFLVNLKKKIDYFTKKKEFWLYALIFALCFYVYDSALYVSCVGILLACFYYLSKHLKHYKAEIKWLFWGMSFSIAVFAMQVLSYYGFVNFFDELYATLNRRAHLGWVANGLRGRFFENFHHALITKYGLILLVLVYYGILRSCQITGIKLKMRKQRKGKSLKKYASST